MNQRVNYYKELTADYSRPGLVSKDMQQKLIQLAEELISKKEDKLPEINSNYTLEKIEKENDGK